MKAIKAIMKKVDWELKAEECPEEPIYKYHIKFYYNNKYIWDDWFIKKPNDTQIYNIIKEVINEGIVELQE